MRNHFLKIGIDFADDVLSGEKGFELRRNDRGYQKGDLIRFEVVDRMKERVEHELNGCLFEITYVLNGWGLKNGYAALSIRKIRGGGAGGNEEYIGRPEQPSV